MRKNCKVLAESSSNQSVFQSIWPGFQWASSISWNCPSRLQSPISRSLFSYESQFKECQSNHYSGRSYGQVTVKLKETKHKMANILRILCGQHRKVQLVFLDPRDTTPKCKVNHVAIRLWSPKRPQVPSCSVNRSIRKNKQISDP